jgi:hypothetical protein
MNPQQLFFRHTGKAGIHPIILIGSTKMDSGFRRNDGFESFTID